MSRTLPNTPADTSCNHRWGIVHDHGNPALFSHCSAEHSGMTTFDRTYQCDGKDGTRIAVCGRCGLGQRFQKGRLLTKAEREQRRNRPP